MYIFILLCCLLFAHSSNILNFLSHYSRREKGSLPNFDLTCFLPINKDDMA